MYYDLHGSWEDDGLGQKPKPTSSMKFDEHDMSNLCLDTYVAQEIA